MYSATKIRKGVYDVYLRGEHIGRVYHARNEKHAIVLVLAP
jgi:hypothetical protein